MTIDSNGDFVLRVDKPVGPTSHDVVAMARRAFHTHRVGHSGTLDPFASGLLLLCVNRATRLAEFLTGLDKTYLATARLDGFTPTDDVTGSISQPNDRWRELIRTQVELAMSALTGTIEQVPPPYSAKKVGGERGYRRARRGEVVELAPVSVRVQRFELLELSLPEVRFAIECSSGTYVRALARDLGRILGTGGYLTELRRTGIGPFDVEGAALARELDLTSVVETASLTPLAALSFLPKVHVDVESATRLQHGQILPHAVASPRNVVVVCAEEELIALAREDGEWLRPFKVWSTADD
jgi:tRNA pseudouridine55 synthase